MIIYNIRANGPYEYDKFMLNYGTIHNEYINIKNLYNDSGIIQQNKDLSLMIRKFTDPSFEEYNGILNTVAMTKQILVE